MPRPSSFLNTDRNKNNNTHHSIRQQRQQQEPNPILTAAILEDQHNDDGIRQHQQDDDDIEGTMTNTTLLDETTTTNVFPSSPMEHDSSGNGNSTISPSSNNGLVSFRSILRKQDTNNTPTRMQQLQQPLLQQSSSSPQVLEDVVRVTDQQQLQISFVEEATTELEESATTTAPESSIENNSESICTKLWRIVVSCLCCFGCCQRLFRFLCCCCCCCCYYCSCFKRNTSTSTIETTGSTIQYKPRPLAWTSTTPLFVKFIIPIAIIGTHVLFYHAQTASMWKILRTVYYDISYNAKSIEARIAFDALSLPLQHTYFSNTTVDTASFTYMFAVEELWKAKGMENVILPRIAACLLILFSGIWPHLKLLLLHSTWFFSTNVVRRKRLLDVLAVFGKWSLADVFVVCVMVGVLNVSWEFNASDVIHNAKSDENNLKIVSKFVHESYSTQYLCTKALGIDCIHPSNTFYKMQCNTCTSVVDRLFNNPSYLSDIYNGIEVTGNGVFRSYVAGLLGIYTFCIAAVISILLSQIVDWYDAIDRLRREEIEQEMQDEQRQQHQRQIQQQQQQQQLLLEDEELQRQRQHHRRHSSSVNGDDDYDDDDNFDQYEEIRSNTRSTITQPLLLQQQAPYYPPPAYPTPQQLMMSRQQQDFRSQADIDFDRQRIAMGQVNTDKWFLLFVTFISIVTFGLVTAGTYSYTMGRTVHGAYPDLMNQVLGVDWIISYSLWDIAQLTGVAGKYDKLLEGTFFLFLIIGPILRSLLCLIGMIYKLFYSKNDNYELQQRKKRFISYWIDFIGAFCAWDVFVSALVMVHLLMPSITATSVNDHRCATILQNPTCFLVEFNIYLKCSICCIVIGSILLLLISQHIRSKHY